MFSRSVVRLLLALGSLAAVLACGAPQYATMPVPIGRIGTDGVTIVSEDGDEQPLWQLSWESESWDAPFHTTHCSPNASTNTYTAALRQGAKRVRVYTPGREMPLFGVLALCRVPTHATGPASRMYLVRVPADRVARATDGRVSLIFEPVTLTGGPAAPQAHAWQLWISDAPMP
jgi:hypothetical protein